MSSPVTVPTLGESVSEASIGQWLKQPGDPVALDEPIVSLETDKVAIEVPAPAAGVMGEQIVKVGDTVAVGALIAMIENSGAAGAKAASAASPAPAATAAPAPPADGADPVTLSPAVRRAVLEHGIDPASVKGSGKDGRLTKEDVIAAAAAKQNAPTVSALAEPSGEAAASSPPPTGGRREERVRMTRLRQTIARRLKEAQDTAALLTTFNDVDMSAVIAARDRYRDLFEKKHGQRLGFMGFFAKAACLALKDIPSANARIEGDEIIYHDYVDISVAVSAPGGLVTPVVRDANAMSFAQIERAIAEYGKRARDGALTLADLKGRHLHHLQRRRVRQPDVDPNHQPAAIGGAGPAPHRGPPCGAGRAGGDPADDVYRAVLRPPPDRRARGGDRAEDHQGCDRGSDPAADRSVREVKMNKATLTAAVAALGLAFPSLAHAAGCETPQTGFDNVYCFAKVYMDLDRQLNDNYTALMRQVTPMQKDVLRNGQRGWIAMRNERCYRSDNTGKMVNIDCALTVTRRRIAFLSERLAECRATGCRMGTLGRIGNEND